jgi:type VI secretion system protein ImpJ
MLCTFDPEANPLAIPRYDHLDAGATFEPMFAMALSLLERLIAERFVEIPLERREGGYHFGELRDAAIFRHAFFLAVSGTYTAAQFREHVPRLTKIASARQIGAIVNSAVNGARLVFDAYPPGALPVKPDVVFFRLETAGDFWTDMVSTGTIAIYEPLDPSAVRLALYAVDPETLQ